MLLAVDDEPSVARAVERDLRRRYGRDYRVLRAGSGEEALATLREAKLRGTPIALLLVDQRMPGMSGVELLEAALEIAPDAKSALLTAYADTQAAIDAINRVSLDQQSRVFEPFFTTKGVGEGSGLGLDIVRRIVSGHRGDVTVRSQPGATIFTVALPAAAAV